MSLNEDLSRFRLPLAQDGAGGDPAHEPIPRPGDGLLGPRIQRRLPVALQAAPVGRDQLQDVADQAFVLLELGGVPRDVRMSGPDRRHLPLQRFPRFRRSEALFGEEVRPVIEHAGVDVEGDGHEVRANPRRIDGRREKAGALAFGEKVVERLEVARSGELRGPNDVDEEGIEGGVSGAELGDEQRVEGSRRGRRLFDAHARARMGNFERGDQADPRFPLAGLPHEKPNDLRSRGRRRPQRHEQDPGRQCASHEPVDRLLPRRSPDGQGRSAVPSGSLRSPPRPAKPLSELNSGRR